MKNIWKDLGGKLGVGMCGIGLLVVFLGWNGAASQDRVPSQFPYLISGGVLGLCLVITGVGLIIVQNQRADRAELQATLQELRDALGAADDNPTAGDFSLPPKRPTPPEYALDAPAPAAAVDPTTTMDAVADEAHAEADDWGADDAAEPGSGDAGSARDTESATPRPRKKVRRQLKANT